MAVMEISVVPIGTKTPSLSTYVAKALKVLEAEKGIIYTLCPMGTVIEADSLETLLAIAGKMHEAVLDGDIQRVVTSIKIDDRRDKPLTMDGKVLSVKQKLKK
jgi:uncharacterized protein (TIGR00106 family)